MQKGKAFSLKAEGFSLEMTRTELISTIYVYPEEHKNLEDFIWHHHIIIFHIDQTTPRFFEAEDPKAETRDGPEFRKRTVLSKPGYY